MARDIIFGRTNRDWSCGSMLIPAKEQRAFLDKIDDVRYDVRNASNRLKIGLLSLSAAIGLVAISSVYNTFKSGNR